MSKKKIDKQKQQQALLRFVVSTLEMRIEKTNNRIRIAESVGLSTRRLKLSVKIDNFLLDMYLRALYPLVIVKENLK